MQQIWTDDEITIGNDGYYYLNKNASNRFRKYYSKYLNNEYLECLFEVEWAKEVIKNFPPKIEDNDKEIILNDYNKKYNGEKIDIYILFDYLFSLSSLLNRNISLEELKKYGNMLNYDFKFVDYSFEIYFNIKNLGLDKTISLTSDWYELLTILNVVKKCNIYNIDFNIKNIDDWLYKNKYYSKDNISILNSFFDTLKNKKNLYFLSNEILDYFKNKYDFDCAFKDGVSFNEQNKIIVNYNGDIDFIFMIPQLFNIDVKNIKDIEKYLNFINKKFKINYNTKKFKIYMDILNNKNVLNYNYLLDNISNIEELCSILTIPEKYKLNVINFDIEKIDLWLENNNYYDKKIIEFKELFYDNIKKFYSSLDIIDYLNNKFINSIEPQKFNTQDLETYIIEKHYQPMTEIKIKKLINSLLIGTGLIACVYLKIILNKDSLTIVINCSANYHKLLHSNSKYKELLKKTGVLLYYFCELSNIYL